MFAAFKMPDLAVSNEVVAGKNLVDPRDFRVLLPPISNDLNGFIIQRDMPCLSGLGRSGLN